MDQKYPGIRCIFSDLLTSAISYMLLVGKINLAHPRYDAPMPKENAEIMDLYLSKLHYKKDPRLGKYAF